MDHSSSHAPISPAPDFLELDEITARLHRALPLIASLAVLGLAGGIIFGLFHRARQTRISTIVVELPALRQEAQMVYPDGTPFQTDDLRAPALVAEAAKRAGFTAPAALAVQLDVSSVISPGIIKERDRARAAGQAMPAYLPTEYRITFPAASDQPDAMQRQRLLTEIASLYAERYNPTRTHLPQGMGHVFDDLKDEEYSEYHALILQNVTALDALLTARGVPIGHKVHRELKYFTDVVLPYISNSLRTSGLAKNPRSALADAARNLNIIEENERVARLEDLALSEIRTDAKNPPSGVTIITATSDSVAARAVEVRLHLKQLASDKIRLLLRMESYKAQIDSPSPAVPAVLSELESCYQTLIVHSQQVVAERAPHDSTTAFRVTQPASTDPLSPSITYAAGVGLGLGLMIGLGLGLLRPVAPVSPR